MPLIGQIIDICLYFTSVEQLSVPLIGEIIDICSYFTSLEQLSDAIDRSDHRYLLVFLNTPKYFGHLLHLREFMSRAQFCSSKPLLVKNLCAIYARIGVSGRPGQTLDLLACWIGQIIDICCILSVLSNFPMLLTGQIIDICLYFTSLEQLCDTIDWSDHLYLLVFYKSWAIIRCHSSGRSFIFACILQVSSNYSMPLIGRIIDICL